MLTHTSVLLSGDYISALRDYDVSLVLPWGRKRSDDIRCILWVACITDKVGEARLRWYGHVQLREEDDCVKRILEANVGGQRSRGRQRKRWIDVVKYNKEDLQLNVEDAENRGEWRRRTLVADPLPEGSTAWRREKKGVLAPQISTSARDWLRFASAHPKRGREFPQNVKGEHLKFGFKLSIWVPITLGLVGNVSTAVRQVW